MKLPRKLALLCCLAALAAAPAICPAAQTTKIDINSASSADLQKLKGVDSDTADKIIAGRPYASITQLVSKNIITKAAYSDIKDTIVANKTTDNSSNKKNKNNNNNRGKNTGGKPGKRK